ESLHERARLNISPESRLRLHDGVRRRIALQQTEGRRFIDDKRANCLRSERSGVERGDGAVGVADQMRTITQQRSNVPSVLFKIRSYCRGWAIPVPPAIEDFQPPALFERSLLSPGQSAAEDAPVDQ